MTKLRVKQVPPIVDTMQTYNEVFFDAVEHLEESYNATLSRFNRGCLFLEFEHTSAEKAQEMAADTQYLTSIFKDFAQKCGFPSENVTVEAEYEFVEQPGEAQSKEVNRTEAVDVVPKMVDLKVARILESGFEDGDGKTDSEMSGEDSTGFGVTGHFPSRVDSSVIAGITPSPILLKKYPENPLLTISLDLYSDLEERSLEVRRKLCGLRNSGGGRMKIHSKQIVKYTDLYDHFLPQCMNACLLDDEFSDDVYTVKEKDGVTTIDVEPCSKLITYDYHTKIILENTLVNPTRGQVKQLLHKRRRHMISEAKIRGPSPDLKNGKTVAFKQQKDREIITDPYQFVQRLFVDLNLREYITAFSQNKDGGSYLLEIESYDDQEILLELRHHISEHLLVYEIYYGGGPRWSFPPDDLTKITLHSLESTKHQYLLEVSVRPFHGIVFYDKHGPESYRISEERLLIRLPKSEWHERMILDT